MKHKLYTIASLVMALGVACGAFGAHALRGSIPETDLDIWEKAVFYQLIHGVSVLIILCTPAALIDERRALKVAQLFLFGAAVFCGSLYALVLTNTRWLGAITPIGGLCFIIGWALLALSVSRREA